MVLVVAATVSLALAARWSHVTSAPLDFALARQYHSANIAREFYVRHYPSTPEWQRRIARANYEDEPSLELPMMEVVAATGYRIFGGEHLWIARLLSSLIWILGGVFLYRIARRLAPAWAAFLALGIYLFFPFPLLASTSFQPDPTMVALLLAATLAITRYSERPTRGTLGTASVVSAAAVFIKPGIAALFLLPLFAALVVAQIGIRRAFRSPQLYLFAFLTMLPTLMLYLYSTLAGRDLSAQPGVEVNPRLLIERFYWRDWLTQIETVLRPPLLAERASIGVLVVALGGILLTRKKTARAILGGLFLGYLVLGVVASNQTSTHDYYSLPLIPIIALSLGVAAGTFGEHLRAPLGRRKVRFAAIAVAGVIAVIGLTLKWSALQIPGPDPAFAERVQVYEQIGTLVHHTSSALVLGPGGLWYHGWVAGENWPIQADLQWEQQHDRLPPMSADERFVTTDERYSPALGTIRPRPSVFIVAEPIELVRQPDLCVLLRDFPLLAETPDYLIFDLTRKSAAGADGAVASGPGLFYRLPPAWSRVERGLTRSEVRRALGAPRRVELHRGMRKPVEDWFYGPADKFAIVFVDGTVFAKAQSYR
jgi:hypothetical protein